MVVKSLPWPTHLLGMSNRGCFDEIPPAIHLEQVSPSFRLCRYCYVLFVDKPQDDNGTCDVHPHKAAVVWWKMGHGVKLTQLNVSCSRAESGKEKCPDYLLAQPGKLPPTVALHTHCFGVATLYFVNGGNHGMYMRPGKTEK
eukprot:scaffold85082_cov40-Cyclotella_meneghiniana.AAC.5